MRHYMKGVSIVNKKVLQTLEYYKIIDMLLEEADTPLAKESIRHLLPSSRREEIISWQTETSHALMRLLKQGRLPFHGLTDIRPSLVPLEKGGVLGMGELLDIARCLERCTFGTLWCTYGFAGFASGNQPLHFEPRRNGR